MTSIFPLGIDSLRSDITGATDTLGVHAQHHDDMADAIRAAQTQLRGGTVYNVKHYGALGNGVANDSAAAQLAINAAKVAGGLVYFPPGVYRAAGLVLSSKVHLVGAGVEATILRLPDGANADVIVGENFATLTGGNSANGIYNWSIRDLTIDGNLASNSAGFGIRVYGFGYELRSVRVRFCRQDGIYTEWSKSTLGGVIGDGTMEAHWTGVMSHDNGGNGVTMAGPHDSKWVNGSVFSNLGRGVYVKNTAAMTGGGLQMANVHSWGNLQAYAFDFEDTAHCVNCQAEGAINSQVRYGSSGSDSFKASNSSWMGGNIFAAGGGAIAVEIGGGGFAPISVLVNAAASNCTTALVKFTVPSAGGHSLRFTSYQTSGPVVVGTLNALDFIEAIIAGGGGPPAMIRYPVSLTVPDGEGLTSTGANDQIALKPGGVVAFKAKAGAANVNFIEAFAAIAGQPPSLKAQGSDADVNLVIGGQGAGVVHISTDSVAPGGGATATLGTVGGSGPGGATQLGWLKIRDNNHGVVFIPVWN